jgi:hypothetical protein
MKYRKTQIKNISFISQIYGMGVLLGLVTTLSVKPSLAAAEDFSHTVELNERSKKNAIGVDKIKLLRRKAGPGRDAAVNALIRSMHKKHPIVLASGDYSILDRGKRTRYKGEDGWHIDAFADGTRVNYRAMDYVDSEANPKVTEEKRMGKEELEKLGRNFIESYLSEVIQLKSNESIVPISTSYQVQAIQEVDPGSFPGWRNDRFVVSNEIKFGRQVNGIDVIGPGSKIVVIFANDKTPVGFTYDWPIYEETEDTQEILGINDILERTSSLATTRSKKPTKVNIKKFECGYWDAGARRQSTDAFIQGGCAVDYEIKIEKADSQQEVESSIVDAIPVGKEVMEDDSWPHAKALLKNGDICAVTAISDAAAGEIGPIAPPVSP